MAFSSFSGHTVNIAFPRIPLNPSLLTLHVIHWWLHPLLCLHPQLLKALKSLSPGQVSFPMCRLGICPTADWISPSGCSQTVACWSQLVPAQTSLQEPTVYLSPNASFSEVMLTVVTCKGYDGSIYTMKVGKCFRSGLPFPKKLVVKRFIIHHCSQTSHTLHIQN